MQTTSLSTAQRSYMDDPKAFRNRMNKRAAELWQDGYNVYPGTEAFTFRVHTPDGEIYTVAPLDEGCTCAYQQKSGIPQVACKHLGGFALLIEEQLTEYLRFYRQNKRTNQERAAYWKAQHDDLQAHWEEVTQRIEVQNDVLRNAEEFEDGRGYMMNLCTERSLVY